MGDGYQQPIIVIGMHRSGTSLVTRVLEDLGVFTGWRKEVNDEALFFYGLNEWLLAQSGAAWDHPQGIELLLGNAVIRKHVTDYVLTMMRSPRFLSYLGPRNLLKGGSAIAFKNPWAWKDPRNTYTLPIWRDVFPDCRIINVVRHGVDVANSLVVRQRRMAAEFIERYERYRKLYWLRRKRGGFSDSLRCSTLEGAFSLWEEYVLQAQTQTSEFGDKWLDVRYETLLTDPVAEVDRIAWLCELKPSADQVKRIVGQVKGARAYAYRRVPELDEFAKNNSHRLRRLGY